MEPFPPYEPGEPHASRPVERRRIGPVRRWLLWSLAVLASLWLFNGIVAYNVQQVIAARGRIVESVLEGKGPDKVALISIDGPLMRGEGPEGPFGQMVDSVETILDLLDQAREDPHVKGVLLAVNSPGGGITESDEIHHAIEELRGERKVVLAHFGDLAASGGYYVACAADKILAQPTTVTGSIGVITMLPEISELAKKLGVSVEVVKSGPMKDMGSFLRPITPEERGEFDALVQEMYEIFLEKVWASRKGVQFEGGEPNTKDYWRSLADGRIYTAQQAAANGLVDGICYRAEAIEELKTLTKTTDPLVVEYIPPRPGLLDLLGVAASAPRREAAADPRRWISALSPRVLALWTGRR